MQKQVVVIAGPAGNGKDSVAPDYYIASHSRGDVV